MIWARTRDVLIGRPAAGAGAPVVQLLLILLCLTLLGGLHDYIYLSLAGPVKDFWRLMRVGPDVVRLGDWSAVAWLPPDAEAVRRIATGMAAGVGLLGAVAYPPFRVLVRDPADEPRLPYFIRQWWRSCLWGLLLIPAIFVAAYLLPASQWVESAVLLACVAYLVLGPAMLARSERRSRARRVARWRPECPECSYNLRRTTGERCPECGEAFVSQGRTFRRWAIRRLDWDRRDRGNLVVAYVRTSLMVLCRPCRAARGLCIPDRFGRASRWAAVHLIGFAVVGTLLGGQLMLPKWAAARLVAGDSVHYYAAEQWLELPASRMAVWTAQSFAAWFIAGAFIVLAGVLVTLLAGGRRAAARAGLIKWALYLAAVLPWLLFALYGMQAVAGYRGSWGNFTGAAPTPAEVVVNLWPPRRLPFFVLTLPFALWWGRGACVNPYLARRGSRVGLVYAYLLMAAWLLLASLLFAPGPLRALL